MIDQPADPHRGEPAFEQFVRTLSFRPDPFQIDGCLGVEHGNGVLVCAPTGAGKTIVGEFAVWLALQRGTKCFYTTPIKALSNQKYHDLCEKHGADKIGLLTGDQTINGDADAVVMTTEVLRNMIYAGSPALERLSHVVMDEVHYLADRSRGPVWEEVILNLDQSVSIVGLSATVSNSEEFGAWLTTVRGDTEVIVSEHRPVPLDQWMQVGKSLYPLFEPATGGRVNRELAKRVMQVSSLADSEAGHGAKFKNGDLSRGRGGHSRHRGKNFQSRGQSSGPGKPLTRPETLQLLHGRGMLPAIMFIFSRNGCDQALWQCARSHLVLTSDKEAKALGRIIDDGVAGIPAADLEVLRFAQWKSALMRGFAAHHAGMLPAFRHIVEECFSQGLLKAVFATETLALGINMPARTVVLEKLVKFNGESHVDLTPGEYTQLTGRAGRRGIDTMGNAVVQWTPAVDPTAVAGLASTRTYPLISTFTPGYNMSVNLLRTIGFRPAHRLIERSFAQFQTDGDVVEEADQLARAEAQVKKLESEFYQLVGLSRVVEETSSLQENDLVADPAEMFLDYMNLRRQLTLEEKKARRISREDRQTETMVLLRRAQPGDVLAIPARKNRMQLAVVVKPAGDHRDPAPVIVTLTGWKGRLHADDIQHAPQVVGRVSLPKTGKKGKIPVADAVQAIKRSGFFPPAVKKTKKGNRGSSKVVAELRKQIRSHPAHVWPSREELARTAEKLLSARRRVEVLEETISKATDSLGKHFDRIVDLLAEMNYVEFSPQGEPVITEDGERLAYIHNESDLLVAQCLRRGVWNDLDPAELAGVVSLCTFENRRESSGAPEGASDRMVKAMENTVRIWEELIVDERRHNLFPTRPPEAAFALAIHQWTAGAPMGYCLSAAAACGAELTPGDFVRWCRQVVDLLGQVASSGYTADIKHNAFKAIDAIRRGVVAIGA